MKYQTRPTGAVNHLSQLISPFVPRNDSRRAIIRAAAIFSYDIQSLAYDSQRDPSCLLFQTL